MKQEIRLLKQEIDLQPKDRRKDEFRKRRGLMDIQHEDKERAFLQSLSESHELALRRLSEKHRDRLATIDKNFLQQKQTVINKNSFVLKHLFVFERNMMIFFLYECRQCEQEKQCYGNSKKNKSMKSINCPSDT